MNKEKILNYLGLASRARKLVLGEEFVLAGMKQSSNLVFLAKDAGKNISKKVMDKSNFYGTSVITLFTTDELSNAIGKSNRKVLLLEDKGFIHAIKSIIDS
jgi:ribosomal protein L7Ae-like RNA K-turn-binding protein